jgi:long-chain acyl-CoA synthetase
MNLIEHLNILYDTNSKPFLIYQNTELKFSDIINEQQINLDIVNPGDVVALIGDFNASSISTLLRLIDLKTIIVPLTIETKNTHNYFFESALVDVVIDNGTVKRIKQKKHHTLIENLRQKSHAGLILFSTGTTGRPKAILHDMTLFLERFQTPRPTLKMINFLLFDHIGGINTLLHTIFNRGVVVAPIDRNVDSILQTCAKYKVEVLPTTPTFLRLMLLSGSVPSKIPNCLKIITYGTERMDQSTLDALCNLLPNIDFRQTYGMSELGIVRVKSKARNSLYMKIGGEGVETKIDNKVLKIRSKTRMLGYLNAESPFNKNGWYDTKDIVDERDGYIKITGRTVDVINVGGLKFMASEVERIALMHPNVGLVKAYAKNNPLTGQHVEILINSIKKNKINKKVIKEHFKSHLPAHMVPKRIIIDEMKISHRYKKL